MIPTDILSKLIPEDSFVQPISNVEIGLLFRDGEDNVKRLQDGLAQMREDILEPGRHIQCGVSARMEGIESFHIAVRQAHVALQKGMEFSVYHGSAVVNRSVSWLQYETMYQKIASDDEQGALAVLQSISGGSEMFYSIRFMLRSAADEAQLPFSENELLHYDSSIPGSENILRLGDMVKLMFSRIRQKQRTDDTDRQSAILEWLFENFADYNLCAAYCASHFGVSEKFVYTVIRNATGMSFNEYVVHLRMERAGRLLLTTRDSVSEIVAKCGYQATNTFYRVFKKYYGVAPAEFRNKGGR